MDEKILITGNTAKFNAIVLPGTVQDRITVFRSDNGDEYESAGVSWVQTRSGGRPLAPSPVLPRKVTIVGSDTYISEAQPNNGVYASRELHEAAAVWIAWKIDSSGSITLADGNNNPDNVATDLPSLTYL